MKPNQDEIQDQIYLAEETKFNSKFPGMTYEDGVIAALEWVLENGDNPMDE